MRFGLVLWIADVVLAASTTSDGAVLGVDRATAIPAVVGLDATGQWVAGDAAAALPPDRIAHGLRWWEDGASAPVADRQLTGVEFVALLLADVRRRVRPGDELTDLTILVPGAPSTTLQRELAFAVPDVEVRCWPSAVAAAQSALVDSTAGATFVVIDWRGGQPDVAMVQSERDGFRLLATDRHTLTDPGELATVLPTISPNLPWLLVGGSSILSTIVRDAVPSVRTMTIEINDVVVGAAQPVNHVRLFPPAGAERPQAPPEDVRVDDDVQFTVYRPRTVRPGNWEQLVAFAHKTEAYEEGGRVVDPLAQVGQEAAAVLGPEFARYLHVAHDSDVPLPRGAALRFVPDVPGLEFSPAVRDFRWLRGVHREEFLFRADAQLEGTVARGSLAVFFGTMLIADVNLSIRVDSTASDRSPDRAQARPYRKIFPSYSHRDSAIVDNVALVVSAFGDDFMRDVNRLRSGEIWNTELANYIREADVFQLYWSTHSMTSEFVHEEWRYALSLNRPGFIRPVFWERPRPTGRDLPPPELDRIHFSYLPIADDSAARAVAVAVAPPPPTSALPPQFGPPPGTATGAPPASARPRRKGRLVGVMSAFTIAAVAAIAVTIGVSSSKHETVGAAGPRPSTTTSSTFADVTPPSESATVPDSTNSQLVIGNFLDDLNARDVSGARALVCATLQATFDQAATDPNGLFAFTWRSPGLLSMKPAGNRLVLTYQISVERAGKSKVQDVTFTMVSDSGPRICGIGF